ncbi:MAG: hypothetical protein ACREYC_00405 [Gammaproteobacteria bacterium]
MSELWVIPEDQHVYDDYWGDRRARLRLGRRSPRAHRRNILDVEHATSEATRAVVAEMYEHFWRGDAEAMRRTMSEQVVVNIVGRSTMSSIYRGWDGYLAFRDRLMSMAGDKYKLDLVALAASSRDA